MKGVKFDAEQQTFSFDFEHAALYLSFAQPMLQELELVKALPASISFDMQAYEKQYLNEILRTLRIPCRVLLFTLTSTISYKNPLLSYNFFHISLF
jgi:hypothetical protein